MSSSKLESPGAAALLAGIVCYAFALTVTILLPVWLTNQDVPKVVGVDGVGRDVQPYSAAEAKGREVYGRQVCFHCHSQFIRPVSNESRRWGPVSTSEEYQNELQRPVMFGTRRVGPDLSREGGRRGNDWHAVHFFKPKMVSTDSPMPSYPWFFDGSPDKPTRRGLAMITYVQWLGSWLDSYPYYEELQEITTDE